MSLLIVQEMPKISRGDTFCCTLQCNYIR